MIGKIAVVDLLRVLGFIGVISTSFKPKAVLLMAWMRVFSLLGQIGFWVKEIFEKEKSGEIIVLTSVAVIGLLIGFLIICK